MTQRAVVVTGASSGIGAAAAELLAREGFLTYAGVRSPEDGAKIAALHENIRPLRLDVTDRDSIASAAEVVTKSGAPLHGLVSNAGIAVGGPLEFLPVDELRRQFEVNVFGGIAVSQAFLPQLRASRGRIVFVGSVSGRIAVPYLGPYAASKFALRALSDALRAELAPAGVFVALVEPGSVKTPIWKKGRESRAQLEQTLGSAGYRVLPRCDRPVIPPDPSRRAGRDARRTRHGRHFARAHGPVAAHQLPRRVENGEPRRDVAGARPRPARL